MRNALCTRSATFALVLLVVLSSSSVARAADKDFSLVVNHIKAHYHTKPHGGFLLGLAGLAVKMAHPDGIKSLKLAVFDEFEGPRATDASLDELLRTRLSAGWSPMVRVRSRSEGSEAYVYVRESGKDFEVLVVAISDDGGAVVQAKVDPTALMQIVNDRSAVARGDGEGSRTVLTRSDK